MKYEVRFTNQFKKDLKLAKKQGKNTDKLFEVIEKLANGNEATLSFSNDYLDNPKFLTVRNLGYFFFVLSIT